QRLLANRGAWHTRVTPRVACRRSDRSSTPDSRARSARRWMSRATSQFRGALARKGLSAAAGPTNDLRSFRWRRRSRGSLRRRRKGGPLACLSVFSLFVPFQPHRHDAGDVGAVFDDDGTRLVADADPELG